MSDRPVREPIRAMRPLVKEPLTSEDWEHVWLAYQGFLHQVHLIVGRARERENT